MTLLLDYFTRCKDLAQHVCGTESYQQSRFGIFGISALAQPRVSPSHLEPPTSPHKRTSNVYPSPPHQHLTDDPLDPHPHLHPRHNISPLARQHVSGPTWLARARAADTRSDREEGAAEGITSGTGAGYP
jgi:hypothetical protein